MPKYILIKENDFDEINYSPHVFEAENWEAAVARFIPSSVEKEIEEYKDSHYANDDAWEDYIECELSTVDDFESNDEFEITGLNLYEITRSERLDDKARKAKQIIEAFKKRMEEQGTEEAEREEYERLKKKYCKKKKRRK
jgi:hypothetical protein